MQYSLLCSLIFLSMANNLEAIKMIKGQSLVQKKVLSNGMTVLVRPIHTVPKVSTQLWYNVGSKDEKDKERGIAHLIEHMIFKGTEKLSESDINNITHMLSGSCNAFTSYDYTGYLFNFPTQHWQESLNLMADCMTNCTFKDYMLNSEMKAVIQELKMYKDHYVRSLVDEMIGGIFQDHPYHHPIIGYKQDLWSVSSDGLKAFYKKHYVPNNATLVVVGDVDPQEVFKAADKKFSSIPADPNYRKETFYYTKDIVSKSITMYRDVKQPVVVFTFVVPGIVDKKDNILELLARILGSGKGSRLYKKIVNDLQLATSLSASSEELFEYGLFFIAVEPKTIENIPLIEAEILKEIAHLAKNGVTDAELERAIKKTEMSLYSTMEDFEQQAYDIGKYYLATGDENYLFHYLDRPPQELKKEIHELVVTYLRPSVLHKGMVLPMPEAEKATWALLQKESDLEDERILSARDRTEPVEAPSHTKHIEIKQPQPFDFPKATVATFDNGLKLFSYNSDNIPKIDLILDLKAKYYYDPEDKQGIAEFLSRMLLEGTKNYPGHKLIDATDARGMSISTYPGGIAMSMLAQDLPFGLEILSEILTNALFDAREIEKVRAQLIAKLRNFWDEPRYFAGQLVREQLYKGHPYSKNSLGTIESIESISRADLIDYYKKYVSPHGARLAIVGDIKGYDLEKLVQHSLGKWTGPKIVAPEFPQLNNPSVEHINYPINRDQIVLRFAGLSVDRKHQDFDKLLLYDQIFSGGALGSMASRLFELREQSGLFYTIGGSMISGADEQPGMILVQTIVSLDRLREAEKAILKTMQEAPDSIREHEFTEAQHAIVNTQIDNFASNYNIANVFLFLDRYNLPVDFFDNRAATLNKITIQEVKEAAKRIMKNKLITLRAGRVADIPKAESKTASAEL